MPKAVSLRHLFYQRIRPLKRLHKTAVPDNFQKMLEIVLYVW